MELLDSTLPRGLRRFGFVLWVLSLPLIGALAWQFLPAAVLLFLVIVYAAAFVLFMLMVIRHYYRAKHDNRSNPA